MEFIEKDGKQVCVYCILEQFRRMGGDFVKQLGLLWWHADQINKRKLVDCFSNYFEEYAAVVIEKKARCCH